MKPCSRPITPRRMWGLIALLSVAAIPMQAQAENDKKPELTEAYVASLLEKMDSPQFRVREAATQELESYGARIVPLLAGNPYSRVLLDSRRLADKGQWWQFHLDRVVYVRNSDGKLIDLNRRIASATGAEDVKVYQPTYLPGRRDVLLVGSSCGMWKLSPDGKVDRIELELDNPDVTVVHARYPQMTKKRVHFAAAVHDGGQMFELACKTLKPRKTGGYYGFGPQGSFWTCVLHYGSDQRYRHVVQQYVK
ncbi:MAG: hypothetical protein ACLFVU_06445 [Phycisphaerae bacterium]